MLISIYKSIAVDGTSDHCESGSPSTEVARIGEPKKPGAEQILNFAPISETKLVVDFEFGTSMPLPLA